MARSLVKTLFYKQSEWHSKNFEKQNQVVKKTGDKYYLARSEHSAVWLAHLLWEQRVGGSNPSAPNFSPPATINLFKCLSPRKIATSALTLISLNLFSGIKNCYLLNQIFL